LRRSLRIPSPRAKEHGPRPINEYRTASPSSYTIVVLIMGNPVHQRTPHGKTVELASES